MKITLKIFIGVAFSGLFFQSCVSDPNSPGLEYMPDMYRSPAIEAYVDYGQDPYRVGEDSVANQMATISARKPVDGSIPYNSDWMPYPYANTIPEYERAGRELTSPLPMTKNHIEKGKEVYARMCSHCHGEKGEGNGKLVQNEKILGVPNFAAGLKELPEGNMFHTITYGKGIMGAHGAQVNQKERWQIIQWIHIMQEGGKMPKFNDDGQPLGYEQHWYPKGQGPQGNSANANGMVGGTVMIDGVSYDVQYEMMNGMKTLDGALVGKPGYVEIDGVWYSYEEAEKLGFWKRLGNKIKEIGENIKEKRDQKKAEKAAEE